MKTEKTERRDYLHKKVCDLESELRNVQAKSEIKSQTLFQLLIEKNKELTKAIESSAGSVAVEEDSNKQTDLKKLKSDLAASIAREAKLEKAVEEVYLDSEAEVFEENKKLAKSVACLESAIVVIRDKLQKSMNGNDELGKANKALTELVAKQKEELDSREVMEPTNEEFRAIKAEYDALKRRLGSAEYKFISASDIEAIEASMDAETKEFLIEFNNEDFTEAERVKFLIAGSQLLNIFFIRIC